VLSVTSVAKSPFLLATESTEGTEKFMNDQLTERIIGAAIEVHRLLGPGLLESIYEEALCHELNLRKIEFERQVEVDVIYKDYVIKGQRLDVLVEREVIVELKSVSRLPEVAKAQTLSYLKATRRKRTLLTCFRANGWWAASPHYLCTLCVLCG